MATHEVSGSGWAIDEYVVVADLYLRRQRSSNARDPEVLALAELTGRTGASISRRLGNFHGTLHEGQAGLKPVTGEAREVFMAMRRDANLRGQLTHEARARLANGRQEAPIALPATGVRLVDRERFMVDATQVETPASTKSMVRREAQLVERYVQWLGPRGASLQSWLIPSDGAPLRTDLFDADRNLLIEAKASAGRGDLRYAIGQLYDYQRSLPSTPTMAVLTPREPSPDLRALLTYTRVGLIWERNRGFVEELTAT